MENSVYFSRIQDSVSEYLTELPPKRILEQRLHNGVRLAQARLQGGKHS